MLIKKVNCFSIDFIFIKLLKKWNFAKTLRVKIVLNAVAKNTNSRDKGNKGLFYL